MKVAYFILLICFLLVFIQDWKYRRIHIALPILIFVFSFYAIQINSFILFKILVYNNIFLLFTFSFLVIYMSIKKKQFLNPFQNYFGLGDLLFYVAISPLLQLKNYILFFIVSMLFAIVVQLGLKKIVNNDSIPLAGFSAVLVIGIILVDLISNFEKITLL